MDRNTKQFINLQIARDLGFEPVWSDNIPDRTFYVRCKKCGHRLRVNQSVWQQRHSRKCKDES